MNKATPDQEALYDLRSSVRDAVVILAYKLSGGDGKNRDVMNQALDRLWNAYCHSFEISPPSDGVPEFAQQESAIAWALNQS